MSSPSALPEFEFHKSSFSKDADACVEVARNVPGVVAVRDSKDPAGPALLVSPVEWRRLTASVRRAAL
ncbi:MAG TPA: DUF397 domain-containing protein [Jiangellaceae bacterium]